MLFIVLIFYLTKSELTKEDLDYESWILKYHKKYDEKRKLIFNSNKKWIKSYNMEVNYKALHIDNEFADIDPLEFKDKYIKSHHDDKDINITLNKRKEVDIKQEIFKSLPEQIEWVNYMQPIQDQLNCGSCYAFAMLGAMEGVIKIENNIDVKLSEQYILDCSSGFIDNTCNGATVNEIAGMLINRGVIEDEDYRSYFGMQLKCKNVEEDIRYYLDNDKTEIFHGEYEYMIGLQKGPLYVHITSDPYLTQFSAPNTLIIDPNCKNGELDHAVVLVGYGSAVIDGYVYEYWIIRNSWGTSWGTNGYGFILKGENTCNIESENNVAVLPRVIIEADNSPASYMRLCIFILLIFMFVL